MSEISGETNKADTAPQAASESRTKNSSTDRTDQNRTYSLKVKSVYVSKTRPESLGAIPEQYKLKEVDSRDQRGGDGGGDDGDGGGKKNKRKKKNKINRKRPRDQRQSWAEKICLSVIKDETCPYGEKCRFSHDLAEFMKTRPSDITELDGGSCPLYNKFGYCVYGAMCRFGMCHITKEGANMKKEGFVEPEDKSNMPLPTAAINLIPRDVQTLLRKKKYPFVRKRFDEEKEGNNKKLSEENGNGDENENGSVKVEAETTPAQAPPAHSVPSSSSSTTPVELKTRKIIDFSNKVYVAPLTTVGNLPFRRIMKKFGADITCGEMALATNLLEGRTSEWALMKRHPEEDVYGIQIAAGHADQYTRVAEVIEKYTSVDFVDLNLGCPLDLVCNKGAGAMLMMRDKKLRGSLQGMSQVLSCPITIKMRTGWDMKNPFAHQLVPKIQSWGINGIAAIMVSASVPGN